MANLRQIASVLAHRDFRLLWLAQSASTVGDNLVLVALSLFVIERTGSATDLGFVLAAQALALVAFLLIGGVFSDRLPRQRVIVATDLVRFLLHALLAALIFAGSVALWQLIAIEVLFRSAEAFFRPAAGALLPETVPERDIQAATAATSFSANFAEFAGPALATALVLGAGAGWAFALDAATFLVSAALLVRVRPHPRAEGEPAAVEEERASVWREIREGGREVRARTWIWATLAPFCVAMFAGFTTWYVLGPVVARSQYGHVGVYGFVEAAMGLGTIVGSLAGAGWRPRFPMRVAMLAVLLWPLVDMLYAFGATLSAVMPAAVLAGAGYSLFDVLWLTALAERIPPRTLARVTSYDWMLSYALLPLGYVLAGPIAARLGAVEVLAGGSALAAAALALGLLPRETRMLRRLEREGARPLTGELRRPS
ncbi:MAG TPA: MFS transporter [Solirubrobacteraceae bacterium]|nr:MFS transporter [Solirubrobacteraceae bacterium]